MGITYFPDKPDKPSNIEGRDNAGILIITNRFSTRATRRYAAYKADMEAIELDS